MDTSLGLAACGLLPDHLLSAIIDRRIRRVLHRFEDLTVQDLERDQATLCDRLSRAPVAEAVGSANEQHYEVPARFFEIVLGPRLKYSSCLWPPGVVDLAAAEEAMLGLTAERAHLRDGQRVLELGCGWGSLCLWTAEHFPNSRVLAVTNSASQREFVLARAAERGLSNLDVLKADVSHLELEPAAFDRVVSVEMFEHMKNYPELFARIGTWLRPDGRLFVHVFCHRRFSYEFDANASGAWMARHFFTGGTMPSYSLLPSLCRDLELEDRWAVAGTHYARTLQAWLDRLDAHREAARVALAGRTGARAAVSRASWGDVGRWRLFLMACRQTFALEGGREYIVAHYRWKK